MLVVPGFGVGDRSTAPLRRVLRQLGHRPLGWHQGTNRGPTADTIEGLAAHLVRLATTAGAPIPIVGWSLGGIYGRALAMWYPDLVDQVISLGSPFNISRGEQTFVSAIYDSLEGKGQFVRRRGEIDLDAVPCPSTAVYTRTDGIVPWSSCRQTEQPRAENLEVRGSHCALGVNVAVLYAVADRLTRDRDSWTPFDPPSLLRGLYPEPSCVN